MNAIRTIESSETEEWVEATFDPNPREGGPRVPHTYPFPFHPRHELAGSFLYVVYRGEVIGYGRIKEVRPHAGDVIGTDLHDVQPGASLILDGALTRMPFKLAARGFMGIRYVDADLHTLSAEDAQRAIARALRSEKAT